MTRAPGVLWVQLKRWSWDALAGTEILHSHQVRPCRQVRVGGAIYALRSCVFHRGETSRKGHYVSVCASSVDGQEQWLLRDDEEASVVEHPEDTALWQADENMKVYMLVYERV